MRGCYLASIINDLGQEMQQQHPELLTFLSLRCLHGTRSSQCWGQPGNVEKLDAGWCMVNIPLGLATVPPTQEWHMAEGLTLHQERPVEIHNVCVRCCTLVVSDTSCVSHTTCSKLTSIWIAASLHASDLSPRHNNSGFATRCSAASCTPVTCSPVSSNSACSIMLQ